MTTDTGISALLGFEKIANKDQPGGYPSLDVNARVLQSHAFLPAPSLSGAKAKDVEYQNGSRTRIVVISLIRSIGATNTSIIIAKLCTKSTAGVANTDNPVSSHLNDGAAAFVANYSDRVTIVHVIPANYFYKLITVVSGTASVSVEFWHETDL